MTFQSVDFKSLFSHSLIFDEEMMQHELLRLATFERWPDWAEHRPICLASNGFYYTDHADKVKCFSCGGQLEKLSLIDDITKEHERNFPHCQFVRAMSASKKRFNNCHRSDADNLDVVAKYLKEIKSLSRPTETGGSKKPNEVKSLSRPTETGGSQKPNTPSVKLELMKDEKQRLLTFRGRWPSGSPVSAEDLAKAGFYYSGSGDVVKCAFCAGILAKWMPGDNPLEEHKKFFPSCPFLASAIMCKVSAEVEFKQPVHLNNPQPSEYSVKFPKYRTESSRKESFKNWQKPSVIKPQVLAEAGFYYLGFSDNVKCFCCGGGMRDWNSGDDPWEQHAKWYSNCEYLKQCKGDHFIQQVLSSCAQATNFVGTSSVGAGSGTNNPLKLHDKDFTPCRAVAENLPSLERLTEAFYNDRIMQKIAQGCAASSERNSSGLSRRQKKNQRKKQRRNEEHEETSSCSKNEQLQDSNRGEHSGINPMELTSSDLKDDYNSEQRICKICMDKELSTAFSPCGHVMCCSDCATGLRNCPICRTVITNKFRIYLP